MQISSINLEQGQKETPVWEETLKPKEISFLQTQLQQSQQEYKQILGQKDQDLSLENEFLDAINQIESQSSQINGPSNEELIFLLGNTGSGKSTIFNWLLGRNLKVIRDQKLRAANWIVEVESDENTEQSSIGHFQESTTTIPKIAKSPHGPYLVDFPGWQDTRGWSYDFVNQIVAAHITTNCSKIKILFICDYSVFKSDRGVGIRQLVSNINSFAQGNPIQSSAMLVITKLMLEDKPELYIEDIRSHCKAIIDFDQTNISDEAKTILSSLISNDIFIMEKASKDKKNYSDEEQQSLWKMIDQLQSSSIQLQVYVSDKINSEFSKYFNNEMHKMRDMVRYMIKQIEIIQIRETAKQNNQTIFQMHVIISKAKNDLFQNTLNQITKYEAFERMYDSITQIIKENQQIHFGINQNFIQIYHYFFYLKEKIQAYSIELICAANFHDLFMIELNLTEQLRDIKIINQEQYDQEKLDYEKLKKENQEYKQKFEDMQKQKFKEYNRMKKQIENEKRHFWWFIWKKPPIPDWVEDVNEYLRMENQK